MAATEAYTPERQVTSGSKGRIITNTGVWSPDSEWIVYDTRSDAAGERFDGETVERVHVASGCVEVLYRSRNGAHCGVATVNPVDGRVVFIRGPEHPTPDWQYGPSRRQGVVVDPGRPGELRLLDARDLVPPFTPGALRGGSHVHVWDAAGDWVSFTYEDEVLSRFTEPSAEHDLNLRNVGVSIPRGPVRVPKTHPRNHDGDWFSVLVTRTTALPRPDSDEISRAFEEGWVGTNGYVREDGGRQRRALSFQGHVRTGRGETIAEVFVVDLPDDLTYAGDAPLAGTQTRLPSPPPGTTQRRITFTADRKHPGIQGPRHWLRTSADGSRIAFLMKDDSGVVQVWSVSPKGGQPQQVTRNPWPVASTFSWSPDGRRIAYVMDRSVCVTEVATGVTRRLTAPSAEAVAPRPEACVVSPNGRWVAFVRRLPEGQDASNQICVVATSPDAADPAPR